MDNLVIEMKIHYDSFVKELQQIFGNWSIGHSFLVNIFYIKFLIYICMTF